jgi:hypothetical protein
VSHVSRYVARGVLLLQLQVLALGRNTAGTCKDFGLFVAIISGFAACSIRVGGIAAFCVDTFENVCGVCKG